jgi:hypothetical protein
MKTLKHGAFLVLAMTNVAALAAQAPAASAVAPSGYAAKAESLGRRSADALAQENERLSKCKVMRGDEKKGCEAHARSVAKASSSPAATAGGSGIHRK